MHNFLASLICHFAELIVLYYNTTYNYKQEYSDFYDTVQCTDIVGGISTLL